MYGVNTVYINPPMSEADKINNKNILTGIDIIRRHGMEINMHLIQKRLQECESQEITRLLKPGRTIWVSVNSLYYIGDYVMKFCIPDDQIALVGHYFHSKTMVGEVLPVVTSSSKLDAGNHAICMQVDGTSDDYYHSPRSMLDSDTWYGPNTIATSIKNYE